MAFVFDGVFDISMTVVDQGAQKSTLKFRTRPATVPDFAGAVAAAAALQPDLEAVITGNISAYRITAVYNEDAFVVPADAQNQDKASVSFTNQIAGTGNFKIPSPANGIFVAATGANNNIVDLADADLVAYADNFRSTGFFTIDGGNDLVQMVAGKRIHAKSNLG